MIKKEDDSISKEYYKIGEVAEILDIPASTLRFWEKKFTIVNPRRANGHRYYSPKDVEIIRMIHFLVKERGLKIEAAQQEIKRNRQGVDARFKVVERLEDIKERLNIYIETIEHMRRRASTD